MAAFQKIKISTLFKLYYINHSVDIEEQIIEHYMPMIKKTAGKYTGKISNIEFDDLVSFGMEGLLKALRSNKAKDSKQFTSYAVLRVNGAIVDGMSEYSGQLKRQAYRQIKEYKEYKHAGLSEAEIIEKMSLSKAKLKHIKDNISYQLLSLNDYDEEGTIIAAANMSPEEHAVYIDEKKWITNAIKGLNDNEKAIYWLYYDEQLSMKKVSEKIGISEARVCQINKRMLKNLKEAYQLSHAV